jgi:hypothetical protein
MMKGGLAKKTKDEANKCKKKYDKWNESRLTS